MSENYINIYRKGAAVSKADQLIIQRFAKTFELELAQGYQEGDYTCYRLEFFDEDLKHLAKLLNQLDKRKPIATVVEYYFEQTAQQLYYAVIQGALEEFSDFEAALEAIASSLNALKPTKKSASELNYQADRSSLIKLYVNKEAKQALIDGINEKMYLSEQYLTHPWAGEMDLILRFGSAIIDRGLFVVIVLNVYDQALFPDFPTEPDLQTIMEDNRLMNKEIAVKQTQFLEGMGVEKSKIAAMIRLLPIEPESTKQWAKAIRFEEAAEVLLNNLLALQGVTKGSIILHSHLLALDERVGGQGSQSDGVLFCHLEERSDVSDWIK